MNTKDSSFAGLITPNCVDAKISAQDWQEAIEYGGKLLVRAGYCTPNYIEAMKQAVTDLGPYIVIAPGVAMPHARAESGVLSPGLSVCTLANPVSFGHKHNDPVDLVISFATLKADAHLVTLRQIVALLQDEARVAEVRQAPDSAALYQALTRKTN
ncbi:hypothetical protein BSR29_01085 [Boudabousia liubingyangii]|uniref:Ascorbate-specific PTS system EIIA component n=1 Tax=Boudabousia liubingyangii TaxID=1921764 RepID=A0A1Q5PPY3_9ACTO|nr:PTS sugar transporter subunit IIA [Boudabousia liubingyangii]OKL48391.1 hypothetical protein BSR28_01435 [Boudabousia liubingyangii]OKL49583.1 hypothetical protein BSR29_01085 [Boudabousia liubingyangii]